MASGNQSSMHLCSSLADITVVFISEGRELVSEGYVTPAGYSMDTKHVPENRKSKQ